MHGSWTRVLQLTGYGIDSDDELVVAELHDLVPDQPEHPLPADEHLAVDLDDAPARRGAVLELDHVHAVGQGHLPARRRLVAQRL